jgi:trigger factor
METTLDKTNPVEYELHIHATAEDIEPELKKALKEQSKNMDVQGFRKGKVPLGLVKKMHGQAIGYKVAEEYVQDVFDEQIEEHGVEPLGRPSLTQLDYEVDGDLEATIRFGVRPEVELKDVSEAQVSRLVHEVTDEDVEDEIDSLRTQEADLIPVDDEPAGEEDFVNVDLQRIDPQTDTPIIGDKDEDLTFFLDDERLKEELREALIGRKAGDTFRVRLPQGAPPQQQGQQPEEQAERLYEVTLNDVKRRELPPVDDEFVRRVTDGQVQSADELRDEIRHQLQHAYENQSREMVQAEIVDTMLEMHAVPVPDSVIEMNLDQFVQQVKQQNDGDLPDDFDEEAFRARNRGDAEKQGRWMLIRDEVIEQYDLEATDEDVQEFFAEQAEGDDQVSQQQIEQFYRQMPQMMERVKQKVLSDKVYDALLEEMDVQEKSREEFQEEMEQAQRARQAAPGGQQQPAPGPAAGGGGVTGHRH